MTSYKEVWNAVMNLNKCEFIILFGTLTPNGSFSMSMIQKVGTSFNHVGGFQ